VALWRRSAVALQAVDLAEVLKVNEEELLMLGGWLGMHGTGHGLEACARLVLARAGRPCSWWTRWARRYVFGRDAGRPATPLAVARCVGPCQCVRRPHLRSARRGAA
jgi:hypothetical protein